MNRPEGRASAVFSFRVWVSPALTISDYVIFSGNRAKKIFFNTPKKSVFAVVFSAP
jgi:hypothetical protein